MNNGPEVRAAMRSALLANGVPAVHVDEVVDLAIHAADRAVQALLETARLARGSSVGMCMVGVATGLLRSHLDNLDAAQAEVAEMMGHPLRRTSIRVGA